MRRVIMAAVLLVSTVSVFAADVKSEGSKNEKLTEISNSERKADECSITVSTTLGPGFANVQVTCKGTAATCKEAAVIVKSCLDLAKTIIK